MKEHAEKGRLILTALIILLEIKLLTSGDKSLGYIECIQCDVHPSKATRVQETDLHQTLVPSTYQSLWRNQV